MTGSSTLVARMTSNGRGAVATVRVVGDLGRIDSDPALFHAANGWSVCQQSLGRVVFGRWGNEHQEDVVICRSDIAALDVHCHGGDAAAEHILSQLVSRGCVMTTSQNLLRDTNNVLNAELAETLSRTSTLRAAEIVLEQSQGLLRSSVEAILLADGRQRIDALSSLLRYASFGLHLSDPWNVVLFGRPNAGKSSLINAIVGYSRSIVYDEPGTTRDVVTVETAIDGWPIRLCDTAGICETADTLEATGIERAKRQLVEADCRVLVVDSSRPPQPEDRQLIAVWPDAIFVAHKCDLPCAWTEFDVPESSLRVSSLTGDGISALVARMVGTLIPELPEPGRAIPVTPRQVTLLEAALESLERNRDDDFRAALTSILS